MDLIYQFKPFLKYCVVGASGTVVDVGSLFLLVQYGHMAILMATTIAFTISVINNFTWNKIWTFRNKSTNYRKQFIKFFLVACIGLCITLMCMYIQVAKLGVFYIYAKLITSVVVLTWNFMANKYWTFQIKPRPDVQGKNYLYDYSIVIPAYNEAKRVVDTLLKVNQFRETRQLNAEIIVVDDGSQDNTSSVVVEQAKYIRNLKCIRLPRNQGKGAAIKKGILEAQGHWILFTDADNSTPIEEMENLAQAMNLQNADIAIGSRYLKGSRVKIKQSALRIMIGRIGNILVRSFIIDGIKDSQCGFKLFKSSVAQDIFSRNKIRGWGFDIEVLAIAKAENYKIIEVPVSWYNSPDSRLRPVRDAIRTFMELIMIKLNMWCGRYDID